MSLDVVALEEELRSIEAERETTEERLRLFSQRGRGRGRGGRFSVGRGVPSSGQPGRGQSAGEGLSAGLRSRLGSHSNNKSEEPGSSKQGDWRGDNRNSLRDDSRDPRGDHRSGYRSHSNFERYEPAPAEPAAEEPLPGSNKGRLASAIVVDAAEQGNEPGTSRRPLENGSANPAVKQRNKRLFGSLLGTLQKFQEEDQRFKRSKLAQSRAEAEQRAESRAALEAQKLREQQRQDIAKARLDEINKKRELDAKLTAKRHEILVAQKMEREVKLGAWLKTATAPPLMWLPKFHNEDTELLLEQRQADLEAWKEAQITRLATDKAQIEGRFRPLEPRPRREAPTEMEEVKPEVEPAAAEPERYEAEADEAALEEAQDALPDDGNLVDGAEVGGVADLLS